MVKTIDMVLSKRNRRIKKIADLSVPIEEKLIEDMLNGILMGIEHRSIWMAKEGSDCLSIIRQLKKRRALISLEYVRQGAKEEHPDQKNIIPGPMKFGEITGFKGNRKSFAFSVTIQDHTIAEDGKKGQEIGAPRTLRIMDDDGRIRPLEITVKSFGKEGYFIGEGEQMLKFKKAVCYQRCQSSFGAPHLGLKIMEARLVKDQKKAAFCYEKKKTTAENMNEIRIETLKTKLYLKNFFTGKHAMPVIPVNEISNYWLPMIRYIIRANELAYFLHGDDVWLPWWMKKDGYEIASGKYPGDKSKSWCHVDLDGVGNAVLRWRKKKRTMKVLAG
ncbi:hypothetical protein ACFL08_03865 [Patescibacteria group bacterium]